MVLLTIGWVLGTDHVSTPWEFYLFATYAGWALLISGAVWMLYIAVEPFVRRQWPQVLVSWTRMLSGDWRDPLLGRDVLAGCVFGVTIAVLSGFLPDALKADLPPVLLNAAATRGAASLAGNLAAQVVITCGVALMYFCLLFLLRIVLRRDWLAIAVFLMVMPTLNTLQTSIAAGSTSFIFFVLAVTLLRRVGLLALVVGFFVEVTLIENGVPMTFDPSVWYSGAGFAAMAMIAGLAIYGFRTSLGGRRVFELADM